MRAIFHHVRSNAIAYAALFVALGGTGYAAMSLPKGSVGARQIKDHSIAPVKFNGKSITGSVRAWAVVNSNGKVIAGGGKPKSAKTTITPGSYADHLGREAGKHCATVASIDGDHSPATEQVPIPGNPPRLYRGVCSCEQLQHREWPHPQRNDRRNIQPEAGVPTPLGFDMSVVC